MTPRAKQTVRVVIGVLVSLFFLFLIFREVDLQRVIEAFQAANYWWFVPATIVLFASHWLRALRHRYLLDSVRRIRTGQLFNALLVGYMANTILPAHLGELLRAYIVGKKGSLPGSLALATIAVERAIDVFALIFIMGITFVLFPFPVWVRTSGYLMFGFAVMFMILLIGLRIQEERVTNWMVRLLRPLPARLTDKVVGLLRGFVSGIVPLRQKSAYVIVTILSLLIWAGYGLVFVFGFWSFDFVSTYSLPWTAALVTLVITTIAVVVPSSPGYVGTYHWLCMKSLELFGVPGSVSLSFAVTVHAVSIFPVAIVGFLLAWKEGYSISKMPSQDESDLSS
jgi:uncharacterized protein (TIRG00374 family)